MNYAIGIIVSAALLFACRKLAPKPVEPLAYLYCSDCRAWYPAHDAADLFGAECPACEFVTVQAANSYRYTDRDLALEGELKQIKAGGAQ